MADTHDLFKAFHDNQLVIPASKHRRLMESKDAVRKTIEKYVADRTSAKKPKFFIQGSYKMETMVRTRDNTCDLDDGIHFKEVLDVTPATAQSWILKAVENQTDTPPMHKAMCVRVIYKDDYHIDLPVYCIDEKGRTLLAVKNGEWEDNDPRGFVKWFQDQIDEARQLRRLVRYLKAWCDHKTMSGTKMPAGVAMTVLAANHVRFNDRDDVALLNTLIAIRAQLEAGFTCRMPVCPYDDLLADYSNTRRDHFLDNLDRIIKDGETATESKSRIEASKKWRKHFGHRFPVAEDDGDEAAKKTGMLGAMANLIHSGNAVSTPAGRIVSNSNTGVLHKPHRFYGDHEIQA